jgi:hypothetical protein
MEAERSTKRQDALKWLPRIEAPPEPNYSINDAARMVSVRPLERTLEYLPDRMRTPDGQHRPGARASARPSPGI